MNGRKHPRVDLEKKKGLYFLIGLTVALSAAIFVLELKRPLDKVELAKQEVTSTIEPWNIPTIPRETPDLPEKKTPKPKRFDAALDPEPKEVHLKPEKVYLPEDTDPIDYEPLIEDQPEPLPPVLIERIARPLSCKEVTDKEAALRCLNQWLQQYLQERLRYPARAQALGIEEKIIVKFVVDGQGKVDKIIILRGEDPALVAEARRVIEGLPSFEPASQQGRAVPMLITVPVSFRLQ